MITDFGSNEEALMSGYGDQTPTCGGRESASKSGDESVKKSRELKLRRCLHDKLSVRSKESVLE